MLRRLSVVAAALVLATVAAVGARADTTLTGELGGAPYTIKVPTNWNGTLVVFAHGYRDKADHPGEVDDRSAPASPNRLRSIPCCSRRGSRSPAARTPTTAGRSRREFTTRER